MLGDPIGFIDPKGLERFNFDFSRLTGMPMDIEFRLFDWLKNYTEGMYAGAAGMSTVGGMCMAVPPLFWYGMRNPEQSLVAAEFVFDYLNQVTPPSSPFGQLWYMGTHMDDLP